MASKEKPLGKRDSDGLEKFLAELDKSYGKQLVKKETEQTYDVISTGSPSLDHATGIGGLVRGRIALYWGAEGMGKTTAAIMLMVEAQRANPHEMIVYIDMEQTFDYKWARTLGLDTDSRLFVHLYPRHSEQAADMLRKSLLNKYPRPSLIVVDSVGGMLTANSLEAEAGKSQMGKNAQVLTRMCQASAVLARESNTLVLLISQVRADMGSEWDTFAGPKNLRHSLTQRFQFGRSATPMMKIKEGLGDVVVGKEIKGKMERSKVAAVEGRVGTFLIRSRATEKYGPAGPDTADEIRALVDLLGLVPKTGSYYNLPSGEKVNGAEAFKQYLNEHPEEMTRLRAAAIETQTSVIIPETQVEMVEADEESVEE